MNKLDQLRQIYITTQTSENSGWDIVEARLGQQTHTIKVSTLRAGLVVALLGVSMFGVVQAAQPGDRIYQAKVASDNMVAKIVDQPSISVEKRTNDLLKVSDDPERLDDAVKYYQQTVQETKQQAIEVEEKEQLTQVISQQEERLKKQAQKSPILSAKLNQLLDKNQEEIKGVQSVDQSNKSDNQSKSKQDKNVRSGK